MSNENTPVNRGSEKKTLILAVIAGICGDAILSSMTMSEVHFSIFPWIALVLALQALYQEYLKNPVSEDIPLLGLACFLVGAFGHAAFIKAQYPNEGSNFLSIIISLVLILWIGYKLGFLTKKVKEEVE